jgi:VCBS repeat-containing protein
LHQDLNRMETLRLAVRKARRAKAKNRQQRANRRRRTPRLESLEVRQLLAASIAGTVYNDLNGNGARDQEERGLANWTVFIDLNRDGALQDGEPSALTDADGDYRIGDLAAGDYRVAEVVRSGWTATNPAGGFAEVTARDFETARLDFFNQGSGGTGAITGNVWRDLNANGIKDVGDTGVADWTVFLDLSNDKVLDPEEPFELTDGNGDYTFTGILGGGPGNPIDYEVQQVLTAGWEPAPGFDENYTAAVVEGETFVGPDFANSPVELSGVTGVVWNDINGNGVRDGSEPGLSGWTVYADLNTNDVLDAGEPYTVTGGGGSYSLLGVEPGTHRIAEVRLIDFKPTAPATGYQTVVAPNSGTRSNVNFGNQERTDAAIGGVIYVDRDKDGVRDPGEEGLPGITVYIDADNNSSLDPGETSVVTSSDLFYTPDADEAGAYRFEKLTKGTYVIRQIVPEELSSTPELESEHMVTVGPADDLSDVDCGDQYRPSEIHGVKYEDVNGNHIRDAGEPGIEGVTIFVDLNRDNTLDAGEPTTTTGPDGSYSFIDLEAGAYVVREVVPGGWVQTAPETRDGILWPGGVSNPAVGNVTPTLIQVALAEFETYTQTVSLTLPNTGALTNLVDVFLLFDDTGSFTFNSPIVRAAFPEIIAKLQTRLPGIDLGFGVGRLEEYGSFAYEYSTGRPFILNQPIVASDIAGFSSAIQAALDREAPGYGGDEPETVIEALYQMVTGAGFDGDNNGSRLDSGPAGLASTQVTPGGSGDVPPFGSFTPDPAHGVLPASGDIGGAGFRSGALPIIITATDTGFAYQPKGESTITGIDGLTLPVSQITNTSRGTTPFDSGAGIQETVTGLNALGALVIGLGTNDAPSMAPREGLEALASLTGAINRTAGTIANGTADAIAPGDPFYFKIGSGGDPLVLNIADGIVAAIEGAVTAVNVNVTLRASDPRVHIASTPGVINGLGAGDTATFDVTFTGDGRPHRFDLQFVRQGTDVVLGSIPVVLGTPIEGDGYEFEDCDDGEHSQNIDFGNQRIGGFTPNQAPSFTIGADQTVDEDSGLQTVTSWATNISPGPSSETGQAVDFLVSSDSPSLFAMQPAVSPDGVLTFAAAPDTFGSAIVTVQLHDDGGVAGGGVDTSAPQTFTITINPVNDAPVAYEDAFAVNEDSALTIPAAGVLANDADIDSTTLAAIEVSGPAHGSLTLNADGSFSYTPDANFHGGDSFTYKVSDGALESNVAAVTITVASVNDAPIASDNAYTTDEDTALTIAAPGVLGNDSDVDGDDLTASVAAAPTGGAVALNSDGSFTYTPNAGYVGTDSFTYVAGDGTADSTPATVTIAVSNVNKAPSATDDAYQVDEDGVLTVAATGVLSNDIDPDGDALTAALIAGPAHGTLSLGADGAFVYTPDANFHGGDSFTYTASDGSLVSNVATVAIMVSGVNDAPAAGDDRYATEQDSPLNVPAPGVLANDGDVDGDALNAALITGPAHGLVALTSDGSFTYTPNSGYVGGDSFTYVAGDGSLDSSPAMVTIDVTPAAQQPEGGLLVVDIKARDVFEYDMQGDLLARLDLSKEDRSPRGVATNADGSLRWVVDSKGEVFVYDREGRTLGSWEMKVPTARWTWLRQMKAPRASICRTSMESGCR